MWGEHEGMGWWMLFGTVWFVFFWGLVIWVLARIFGPREQERSRDESALEIAKQRYARGEIGREEFEQMRRELTV